MTAPLHVWHIECVSYTPAWRQDGDLIGFATFELAGGMRLADGRVVRTARSGLGLVFPKRGVIKAREVARRPDGELLVVRQIEFHAPAIGWRSVAPRLAPFYVPTLTPSRHPAPHQRRPQRPLAPPPSATAPSLPTPSAHRCRTF